MAAPLRQSSPTRAEQRNIDLCACLAIDIHTSGPINSRASRCCWRGCTPARLQLSVYSARKCFTWPTHFRLLPIYFDFPAAARQAPVDINCHQFLIWTNKFALLGGNYNFQKCLPSRIALRLPGLQLPVVNVSLRVPSRLWLWLPLQHWRRQSLRWRAC